MHFGIITAGNENLILCKYLNELGCTYTIWYDSLFWPYDDKPFAIVKDRILAGIKFLQQQNVSNIIIHPIFELLLIENKEKVKTDENNISRDFFKNPFGIVPLFHFYLYMYCFKYSLVGKIGIVWTHLDIMLAQDFFKKKALLYQLTENQKNTKKFHSSFSYWCKSVSLRNYLLRTLVPRNYLLTHIVKHDCKYFKDANVDTLIPLQYSYFCFEKYLRHYIRKMRFHGSDAIKVLLQNFSWRQNQTEKFYNDWKCEMSNKTLDCVSDCVNVFVTWSDHLLLEQKKWMRLLWLGKKRQVKITHV